MLYGTLEALPATTCEDVECPKCELLQGQLQVLDSEKKDGWSIFWWCLVCAFAFLMLFGIPLIWFDVETRSSNTIETGFSVSDVQITKGSRVGHSRHREILSFTMNFNFSCNLCDNIDITVTGNQLPRSRGYQGGIYLTRILKTQQNMPIAIQWTKELATLTDESSLRGHWITIKLWLCTTEFFVSCQQQTEGFQIPVNYLL